MSKLDDAKMGSLISNEGKGKIKIGLIGYPIDLGVKRNGGRPGAEGAPEVVRNFLQKKGSVGNSEYEISLENVQIKDFGDTVLNDEDLKTTHLCHQELVEKALKEGYIPISIGGGNDQSFPNFKALSSQNDDKKSHMLVINIDAHLDVRPLLPGNEPHSGSPFRQMLESKYQHSLDFVEFACQGSQCSKVHVEYVQEKGGKIIWLKDLQKSLIGDGDGTSKTIDTFNGIINNEKYDSIFVSFDIDSIRSSDCPGVSCPAIVGLTSDEALSICYKAGQCKKVQLVDISEFNPQVESYRTGILVSNMIYYFLLGVVNRNT